jgi:hypothetical protein
MLLVRPASPHSGGRGLVSRRTRLPADGLALMTERTQNKPGPPHPSGGRVEAGRNAMRQDVSDYVKSLSDEFRMLVILKRQLYGGSWESMLDDLRNRLAGKPYIFKLANRIQDDIERIEQMRKFEQNKKVDLADYVEM